MMDVSTSISEAKSEISSNEVSNSVGDSVGDIPSLPVESDAYSIPTQMS